LKLSLVAIKQTLSTGTVSQLIRDEIRAGKSDKEIYKKLEHDFGETVLYTPKFDKQTAALWLSPVNFFLWRTERLEFAFLLLCSLNFC